MDLKNAWTEYGLNIVCLVFVMVGILVFTTCGEKFAQVVPHEVDPVSGDAALASLPLEEGPDVHAAYVCSDEGTAVEEEAICAE